MLMLRRWAFGRLSVLASSVFQRFPEMFGIPRALALTGQAGSKGPKATIKPPQGLLLALCYYGTIKGLLRYYQGTCEVLG